MRKTTVYLTDEQVEGLRRASAETGKSQAELIRDGVQVVVSAQPPRRVFHSIGVGSSGRTDAPLHWDADELYGWVFGKRP